MKNHHLRFFIFGFCALTQNVDDAAAGKIMEADMILTQFVPALGQFLKITDTPIPAPPAALPHITTLADVHTIPIEPPQQNAVASRPPGT